MKTSTRLTMSRISQSFASRAEYLDLQSISIRTCTSLIAFGFTIFKFFQYLSTKEELRRPIISPWAVGVLMIVIGLTGLTLAWFQHRQEMKTLKAEGATMPYSILGIMAGLIAVLGILALVLVIWRL